MLKSLRDALGWFVEGLVDVLDEIAASRRPRTPLRLVAEGGRFAVRRAGQPATPGTFELTADKDAPRLVPDDSAAKLAGHDIDIVRPSAELIVRSLDPLPSDSRPYLDGIVRHHVERLVPWRADDVLYSYRVAEEGQRDDRLVVTIAATSRAFQAKLIGALTALGAGRLRLLFPDATAPDSEVVIPIDTGAGDAARRAVFRRAVVAGLAVLLFIGVAGASVLTYSWNSAQATVDDAERTIAELRKQLAARGPEHPGQGRDVEAILARRRAAPYAALAINDVAAALPDTTYLTELRIGDGALRVGGVSRNVAELIPLIEAVPLFADARFYAPTTRLTSGVDRFYLEMRLVPAGGKAQ